ncbi:WhiB-like iron-sulfur binding domain containing protein [uncultured Caudovirales phage]|uniref:WhiB-like iron-sulfur binding domain containing protein n=1 Tax=uncultured Caudovirales phage TaxID=2100421 RepID=A0A6J7WL76_9CAUD|nr:WhiB-like iron-sulfur binding domain containing protein [uncultured Caudovirales phage]
MYEVDIEPVTNIHEWMDHAACARYDPELWFAEGQRAHTDIVQAVAICHTCTVQPDCLHYAMTNRFDHGIFAALTAHERHLLQRRNNRNK